jgi:hypothetical protein
LIGAVLLTNKIQNKIKTIYNKLLKKWPDD